MRAWLLGAELYLPAAWLTADRRHEARIPAGVRFQEKWRLALTLIRRVRTAGIQIDTEAFKKQVLNKLLDDGFHVILLTHMQVLAQDVEALYRGVAPLSIR